MLGRSANMQWHGNTETAERFSHPTKQKSQRVLKACSNLAESNGFPFGALLTSH